MSRLKKKVSEYEQEERLDSYARRIAELEAIVQVREKRENGRKEMKSQSTDGQAMASCVLLVQAYRFISMFLFLTPSPPPPQTRTALRC